MSLEEAMEQAEEQAKNGEDEKFLEELKNGLKKMYNKDGKSFKKGSKKIKCCHYELAISEPKEKLKNPNKGISFIQLLNETKAL